eukprot:TRINITY_DN18766_c0_g1_i1.p1 TRINITY_DN18766_c0_g1~~TRINITY_DN18766_c0_g1_i1.p1  ORF type:complete len:347 (-),score=68.03 TRINITY_DN18766_c0_g1_i1:62-1102(-)
MSGLLASYAPFTLYSKHVSEIPRVFLGKFSKASVRKLHIPAPKERLQRQIPQALPWVSSLRRAFAKGSMETGWSKDTIAVVTGSNKGIGFYIARRLGKAGITTVLTARNPTLGEEALQKLKSEGLENVVFYPCDISSTESVDALGSWLEKQYGGIDILVNNAGFAYKGSTFGPEEAKTTMDINYFGTKAVTERLLPLMRNSPSGARIVNVSSLAGVVKQVSESLQAKFLDPSLTVDELSALMEKFLADVKAGTHKEEGWSNSMYGMSKLGVSTYTRILGRQLDSLPAERKVFVYACCPGWCQTDMSSQRGNKTADEGADTPAWLALRIPPLTPNGAFFSEREIRDP